MRRSWVVSAAFAAVACGDLSVRPPEAPRRSRVDSPRETVTAEPPGASTGPDAPGAQTPPPDQDGDGLPDASDACPLDADAERSARNAPPVAVLAGCEALAYAEPLMTAALDAGGSRDPDGDAASLGYEWRLVMQPPGSTTRLLADGAAASLFLDVAGDYTVALTVRDACGRPSRERAMCTINAVPRVGLFVELVWDNPWSDLDLHLTRDGEDAFSAQDCYFANCSPHHNVPAGRRPSWCNPAHAQSQPSLDIDDVDGYGPEIITIAEPCADTYRVWVHYWQSHGHTQVLSPAALRIHCNGVLRAEFTQSLTADGQLWDVATVAMPECDVTETGSLTTAPRSVVGRPSGPAQPGPGPITEPDPVMPDPTMCPADAPVAHISNCDNLGIVRPLETVLLLAAAEPPAARYAWRLAARPAGSTSGPMVDTDTASARLFADLAGDYTIELSATDACGRSSIEPATCAVRAVPSQDLHVQLVWDNAVSDLDLHLTRAGDAPFTDADCNFTNCKPYDGAVAPERRPNWCDPAGPAFAGDLHQIDDPSLDVDDKRGFGPENINVVEPCAGAYRVWVHYYDSYDLALAASDATVRVYCRGELRAELTRRLDAELQLWEVAEVAWPDCEVTELGGLGSHPSEWP